MTKIEGYIDRFEREGAVITLINHASICVGLGALPRHAQAGDFIVEDDEQHLLNIDPVRSALHHHHVRLMMDASFD